MHPGYIILVSTRPNSYVSPYIFRACPVDTQLVAIHGLNKKTPVELITIPFIEPNPWIFVSTEEALSTCLTDPKTTETT
jgi:hypothetical protein